MQHLDDGRLQEWVDRDRSGLAAEEQRAIRRHLAECEDCAERAARLDELGRHARALLSAGLPDELPDFSGVTGRADSLANGHRRRRLVRGGAWAASIALALGIGWAANDASQGGSLAGGDPRTPSSAPRAEAPARQAAPVPAGPSGPASPAAEVAGGEPAIRRPAAPIVDQAPAVVADATPITRADPRVVRGRVTDESGTPIEAAQVVVEGTGIGALTNADGTFRLVLGDAVTVAEAQPLTLMVQRIGYGQVSRELLESGEAVSIDVRLSEQALSLEEVVVTGTSAGERTTELPGRAAARSGIGDSVTVGAARWAPLGRTDAEAAAGFAIMSLPGRPIAEVAVESFEGVQVSRVVQTLEGGTTVMLLQARRPILVSDDLREGGQVTGSTIRDGFFVVVVGAPPVEALQAALDRIR